MGPRSTAPFVDMVIDECDRQYAPRAMGEFPHMIVYSLPAPFRLEAMDHEAVQGAIIAGLQRLESFGVDFIAMPCNTAHLYFPRLRDSVSVPLLSARGIGAPPRSGLSRKPRWKFLNQSVRSRK